MTLLVGKNYSFIKLVNSKGFFFSPRHRISGLTRGGRETAIKWAKDSLI